MSSIENVRSIGMLVKYAVLSVSQQKSHNTPGIASIDATVMVYLFSYSVPFKVVQIRASAHV